MLGRFRKMMEFNKFLRFSWILIVCIMHYNSVQGSMPMPSNYLPKEYFLSDGRRDPRHIQDNIAVPSAPTTTTYHLDPQAPNNALGLSTANSRNFFNSDGSHNAIAMNNQFGIRLVPHSERIAATSGSASNLKSSSQKRSRRRLSGNDDTQGTTGRSRRRSKTYRPPKEFIIYSLPEQSFWSNPEDESILNTGTPSLSDLPQPEREQLLQQNLQQQQQQHQQQLEEEEGAPIVHNTDGLEQANIDGAGNGDNNNNYNDDSINNNATNGKDKVGNQVQNSEERDHVVDEATGGNKKDDNVIDLSASPNPTLSQRKVLLGQCMKSCIDALL